MAEEKKRPEAALHDSLPVIRNDAVVKQKEGATAPQKGDGYIALRELLAKSFTPEEIAEVDGAYALARQSHEGQHRYSGEPYIIHPICVARILAEMGMDKESVIAALLHDVVEDTDETLADITAKFGKTIAHLVDGVTKLGKVPLSTKEEQQAENIRKMLLAMSQDIRVIIIKLADRLHNMRTLNFKPEQKRRDTALETLEIYAPIAHRLGIRAIKEELEREFRRNNIRLADDALKEFLQKIADRQHCNSLEDFYAAIGYGGISVIRMMPSIKEAYYKLVKANQPPEVIITPPKKRVKSSEGVIVEGIDNCLIKFARCCSPLPGDQIIGFITRGHGVSIHKRDCTNVPQVIALCNEPERWINAYWDKNVKEEFKSSLLITCLARVGLLADVSGQLANMHVMIHSMNTRELKDGRCTLTMTITVDGVEHMRSVMAKVSKIDGVLKVDRS